MDKLFVGIFPRLLFGLAVSFLIGVLAHKRGSLSRSGVAGAVLTGTTIFGFGGWTAGLLLIAFFVSSSLLSHFKEHNTEKKRAAEMFDKGGQRDIGQALANGGAAALFALMASLLGTGASSPNLYFLFLAAMLGALATVNADTWATELGVLSTSAPRLITQPTRVVAPGTSGGVSGLGIFSALMGSAFIAVCYVLFTALLMLLPATGTTPADDPLVAWLQSLALWKVVVVAGVIGSLFDSFLGATVQAIYYSPARQKETEKAVERDGTPNQYVRGWRWMNNDWVNFISSLVGAGVAAGLAAWLF